MSNRMIRTASAVSAAVVGILATLTGAITLATPASAADPVIAPTARVTAGTCIDADTTRGRAVLDNTESTIDVTYEVVVDQPFPNPTTTDYYTVPAGTTRRVDVTIRYGEINGEPVKSTVTVRAVDAQIAQGDIVAQFCKHSATVSAGQTTDSVTVAITNRTGSSHDYTVVSTHTGGAANAVTRTVAAGGEKSWSFAYYPGTVIEVYTNGGRLLARADG